MDARYRAAAHILPAFGEIKVDRLTTDHIKKWLRDLAKSPARLRRAKDAKRQKFRELDAGDPEAIRRRRSSANRTFTILKAALNRAWRAGKVASDHAWRKVKPFKKVDAARIRFLTIAEAKRLINACDPDFRRIVQAALYTGARYSELTRLVVLDFNPDIGTISVRRSKSGQPEISS